MKEPYKEEPILKKEDIVGKVAFDSSTTLGLPGNLKINYGDDVQIIGMNPYQEMSASEALVYCKSQKADIQITVDAAENKVMAIYDSSGGEFTFDKKPLTRVLLEAIIIVDNFFAK